MCLIPSVELALLCDVAGCPTYSNITSAFRTQGCVGARRVLCSVPRGEAAWGP